MESNLNTVLYTNGTTVLQVSFLPSEKVGLGIGFVQVIIIFCIWFYAHNMFVKLTQDKKLMLNLHMIFANFSFL